MNQYRYSLENGSRKFPCPKCDQLRFVRYVDNTTGEYFGERFGRCDREQNCGYHVRPATENNGGRYITKKSFTASQAPQASTFDILPLELMEKSHAHGRNNHFVQFLFSEQLTPYKAIHFEPEAVQRVIELYKIGSAREWTRATVFFQIDRAGRVRAGKIILFDPMKGKRIKGFVQWVHTAKGANIQGFQLHQCFFGEHLLKDSSKPVAIVESEKTAVICTIVKPDFIWLATGGKMNFQSKFCRCLHKKSVLVYPDLGAFEDWKKRVQRINAEMNLSMKVSDVLERIATESEREQGLDIADFILKGVSIW